MTRSRTLFAVAVGVTTFVMGSQTVQAQIGSSVTITTPLSSGKVTSPPNPTWYWVNVQGNVSGSMFNTWVNAEVTVIIKRTTANKPNTEYKWVGNYPANM